MQKHETPDSIRLGILLIKNKPTKQKVEVINMKHITEEYGMETNNLTLTWEEYRQLEPFLKKLGVRTRSIISDSDQLTIQGENPYKTWSNHPMCKEIAEEEMSDFKIRCYKR